MTGALVALALLVLIARFIRRTGARLDREQFYVINGRSKR